MIRTAHRMSAGVRRLARTAPGATAASRLVIAAGVIAARSRTCVAVISSIIFPPDRLPAARKSWANWRNEACASAMPSTCAAMARTSHSPHAVGRAQSAGARARSCAVIRSNSVAARIIASRCPRGAARPPPTTVVSAMASSRLAIGIPNTVRMIAALSARVKA